MGRRGKHKYVCDECKAESWHHWIELNRAARPKCPACGSSRIEPCTAAARDAAVLAQTARVFGVPSTTQQPKSSDSEIVADRDNRASKELANANSPIKYVLAHRQRSSNQTQSKRLTAQQAAERISALFGQRIDEWHISRILHDNDTTSSGASLSIAPEDLPRIIETLQSQRWLPKTPTPK